MKLFSFFVIQLYWTLKRTQFVNFNITNDLDFRAQGNIIYGEINLTVSGTNLIKTITFQSVPTTPMVGIWIKQVSDVEASNSFNFYLQVTAVTLTSFDITYSSTSTIMNHNIAYVILRDVPEQRLQVSTQDFAGNSYTTIAFPGLTLKNYISWSYIRAYQGQCWGFGIVYNNVTTAVAYQGGNTGYWSGKTSTTSFVYNTQFTQSIQNGQIYCGMTAQFNYPSVTVAEYNNYNLNLPITSFVGLQSYHSAYYSWNEIQFALQPPPITDYSLGKGMSVEFSTEVFALNKCPMNSTYIDQSCFCDVGFYSDVTASQCLQCDQTCATCNQTGTVCTACNQQRTLQSNKTCTCFIGYGNTGGGNCGLCHTSCHTCSDITNTGCLSCNSTMFRSLQQTSCPCQDHYFDIGTCQRCGYSCLTCTGDANTNCLTCDPTFFRVLKSSYCSCQQGYYDNGIQMCQVCDKSCLSCIDKGSNCVTCDATKFRKFKLSTCQCQAGYFLNGAICGQCHSSCQTCTDATKIDCSSCDPSQNRVLLVSSCICQNGYVDNGTAVCKACDPSCSNCTGPTKTDCSSCTVTNLRTFSSVNNTCSCNLGYVDNNSPMCVLTCDVSCQTCFDGTIQGCLSCNVGSPQFRRLVSGSCLCQKQYQASTNGNCLYVSCAFSQYYDELFAKCGNCDQTCSTCSGPTLQQCLSCDSTNLRNLDKGQCQCNDGYLAQQNQMKCTNACSVGYQLGSKCLSCHPLCSQCTSGSPLDCTSCSRTDYDEVNTNQVGQQYYQNSNINLILVLTSFLCQGSVSTQLTIFDNATVTITGVNLATTNVEYSQSFNSLNMILPKQSFKSGQKYNVSVEVKLMKLSQTIKTFFNLQIIQVPKTVSLVGGNMVIGNTKDLIVSCRIFDFDNQDTPIDPKAYIFTWTCNPVNYNIQCVNSQGLILNTSSTNQNLIISAKDLAPYNSYQIHVAVFDIARNSKYLASANYQVVDLNIPQLEIIYDPNVLALSINLNLEQQFQFDYQLKNVDPDNLFFSANLLYNFDIVSTVIYHYPSVNFRIWDYFENFTQANGTKFYFMGQVYNARYLLPSTFTITMNINVPPKMCEISVTPNEGVELTDLFLIQILNCQSAAFIFTYRFAYYQSQTDYDSDNYYQTLAKASLQTPFQFSNQLLTYLPKSIGGPHIVLVLSVQDNLGAISNYTKDVIVSLAPTIDESKLIKLINNITDSSAQLRYLQVISVTLFNSTQKYHKLAPLMSQLLTKANIFPLSQEQKNQALQIQAFTSSQTTDQASLVQQQQSTSEGLINQIHSNLNYSRDNPSAILNQQIHDTQIIINAQIDSQHILGTSILQNLNQQQNTSQTKNSTHSSGINKQNQQVMTLLNNTRQIKLQQMTINQGTKLLISKYASSAVALATKSKLSDMLGQNVIDDTQSGFLSDQSEESTNDHFSFSYLQYSGNPYSSDQKFPYADQGFSSVDLQIAKQSKNSSIQNSPSIVPSKQVAFIINQKQNLTNLAFANKRVLKNSPEANNSNQTNNSNGSNVCVSKIETKGWSASQCQTVISSNKITCQCNTINPTSVVADFDGLFSGANTQIFSPNVFGAIAHIQWTKVILFWIVVAITSVYIFSVPLGCRKDNADRINELELKKLLNQGIGSEIYDEILNPPLNSLVGRKDRRGLIDQSLKQDWVIEFEQDDPIQVRNNAYHKRQSEEVLNIGEKSTKQLNQTCHLDVKEQTIPNLKKGNFTVQGNLSVQNLQKFEYSQVIESPQSQINESQPNIDDQHQGVLKQEGTEVKEEKVEKNFANFVLYLNINHEMLNVYYSHELLSRATRSTLIYLTLIMSLAITLYFGSTLSFVRSLILSVLSGINSTIIIITLKRTLSARSICVNIIGTILFLALAGFSIFVILAVIATTDSVQQTNIWAIQYGIQLAYNSTVGALNVIVAKYIILT